MPTRRSAALEARRPILLVDAKGWNADSFRAQAEQSGWLVRTAADVHRAKRVLAKDPAPVAVFLAPPLTAADAEILVDVVSMRHPGVPVLRIESGGTWTHEPGKQRRSTGSTEDARRPHSRGALGTNAKTLDARTRSTRLDARRSR